MRPQLVGLLPLVIGLASCDDEGPSLPETLVVFTESQPQPAAPAERPLHRPPGHAGSRGRRALAGTGSARQRNPEARLRPRSRAAVPRRAGRGGPVFEWSAFDHLAITDLELASRSGEVVNWTHGNALDFDTGGNLLTPEGLVLLDNRLVR